MRNTSELFSGVQKQERVSGSKEKLEMRSELL